MFCGLAMLCCFEMGLGCFPGPWVGGKKVCGGGPFQPHTPPPLCDIPSGCCSFTGPWTVTRSSLRVLRRVAAFCPPPPPV